MALRQPRRWRRRHRRRFRRFVAAAVVAAAVVDGIVIRDERDEGEEAVESQYEILGGRGGVEELHLCRGRGRGAGLHQTPRRRFVAATSPD